MGRVAPSVMAREQLRGLLVGGVERESNIVSALVEVVTRLVVQELIEGEQADFLGGRGRYDAAPRVRSGRETVTSAAGCAPQRAPSMWRFPRFAVLVNRSDRR
jgi:hypothetical protein